MGIQTDEFTTRLLDTLQVEVPLVERPFAAIADRLGAREVEVLARVNDLRSAPRPTIRQISAIFDSKALGYQSTLVAAAGLHASGPSPTDTWAMSAEARVMAKPA